MAFALLGQVSVRRVVAYIFCAQEGLCSTFLQAPVRTASKQASRPLCAALRGGVGGVFASGNSSALHYSNWPTDRVAIVATIVVVVVIARRPLPIAIRASESSVFMQWLACLRVVCIH